MRCYLETIHDSIRPYHGIGSVTAALDHSEETSSEDSNTDNTSIMATKQTIGHKRARSLVDSDSGDSKPDAPEVAPPLRAILIHLSALLSSDAAVTYTVRSVLKELLPEEEIPEMSDEDILRAFTTSPRIYSILKELGVRELTNDEINRMETLYRIEYFSEGWPRLCLDPHAKAFLEEAVRQRPHLRLAVMSNNPPKAAELLGNLGIKELESVLETTAVAAVTEGSQAYEMFWDNWKNRIVAWFDDPHSWFGFDNTGPGIVIPSSINGDTTSIDTDTSVEQNTEQNATGKAETSKDHDTCPDADKSAPKETPSEGTNMSRPSDNNTNIKTAELTTPNPNNNDATTNNMHPDPTSPCNANNYHGPNPTAAPLQPREVLVISCALYDLGIANITGMQTCWLRRIKPDDAVAQNVAGKFDMVASGLDEVRVRLFGACAGGDKVDLGAECKWVDNGDMQVKVKEEGEGGVHAVLGAGEDKGQGTGHIMHGAGKEKDKAVLVVDVEETGMALDGAGEEQDHVMQAAGDENSQVLQAPAENGEVVKMEVCDDYPVDSP